MINPLIVNFKLMGQFYSSISHEEPSQVGSPLKQAGSDGKITDINAPKTFYDLSKFPPEIAISILSNLNATDLCLASCVWKELGEDDVLWRGYVFS